MKFKPDKKPQGPGLDLAPSADMDMGLKENGAGALCLLEKGAIIKIAHYLIGVEITLFLLTSSPSGGVS